VGNDVDDRPPAVHGGFVKHMNELAKVVVEKLPNAEPPHTEQEEKAKT